MSLGVCIPDLIANGKIPASRAADMQSLYDDLVAQYSGRMGKDAAEAFATKKTLDAFDTDLMRRKRLKLLQIKAQDRLLFDAKSYDGGKAGAGPIDGRALVASLVFDEKAKYSSVEYRWAGIKRAALRQLDDLLVNHRSNLLGQVRNKSDLQDVVREMKGESTGSLNARELADSIGKVMEELRQRFNAAGGHIGKLDEGYIPQSHDSQLVGRVDAESWIDDILPMLDRQRMIDDATGLPFNDGRIRDVLRGVYETIVSEGHNKQTPGAGGMGAMANRHADHRFLHFKSADDWLQYNEKYGASGLYESMISHIERMSRDIAMVEILGPNPNATVRWMKDMIEGEAATKGGMGSRRAAIKPVDAIDNIYAEITGRNRRVANHTIAYTFSALRNWQSASKLGSASITAISDSATQAVTRSYNGLPVVNTLSGYLKAMNPGDPETRAFARRSGLIGDEFVGIIANDARLHMDEMFGGRLSDGLGRAEKGAKKASELSRRMADGTMRLSGLNAITEGGRQAMGLEFMSSFQTYAKHDFANLPPPFARFLQRNGMGAAEWDKIRATPPMQHKGSDFISPHDIADKDLGGRLFEAMLVEINFAVPTGGLRQQALVNSLPRGSLVAELFKSAFQFKMFPLTVMAMHGGRMLNQVDTSKMALYATGMVGATTLTGAVAYQLKEISKGKDPRPMADPDFWWRSMLQGGAMGLYGDALENSRNEYGQGIEAVTAGPVFSSVQGMADIATGKKGAISKFAQRELPGSSIWYLRAAYERSLIDTIRQWEDPESGKAFDRMEKAAAKKGQPFFLEPGEGLSGIRAPDLGNALVASPE